MNAERSTPYGTFRQLVFVLESVRNRLAVAIACEAKRTTREKWNGYIEMGQRVTFCLRQLRCCAVTREASSRWRRALDVLCDIPCGSDESSSEAARICEHLGRALAVLESEADGQKKTATASTD